MLIVTNRDSVNDFNGVALTCGDCEGGIHVRTVLLIMTLHGY